MKKGFKRILPKSKSIFLAHLQNIGGAQAKKLAIAQVKKLYFGTLAKYSSLAKYREANIRRKRRFSAYDKS